MRLVKLTLNNINSIKDAQIDFKDFQNSLFLISGPTGSGKSTIIDAVCAALYNKTPRLKKSAGELLRHNTKKGFIELEFYIGDEKYFAKWEAKRQKNAINVTHKLYIGDELIDKHVAKKVEEIIKLDFSQFTKAIVLAQGEFDAFLSANSTKKAEILKNILDLEEYEEISIRIYEKTQNLKNEIETLKGYIPQVCESDLEKEEIKYKEFEKEYERLKKELENIKKLKEKEKLKNEIKKYEKSLELIKKEILKKKERFNYKKSEFEKILKEKEEFEKEYKEKILKISALENIKKEIKKTEENINYFKEISHKKRKNLLNAKMKLEELSEELSKIKTQEKEEFLKFDAIQIEFNKKEILKKQLLEAQEKILKIKKRKTALEKRYSEILKELAKLSDKIINPLIIEFEKYRDLLKDNEPCPLCGSLEHPFKKNPPKTDKNLLIGYQKLQDELKKIEEALKVVAVSEENFLKNKSSFDKQINEIDLGRFGIFGDEDFYALKKAKELNDENKKRLESIKNTIENLTEKKEEILRDLNEYEKKIKKLEDEKENLIYKYKKGLNELNIKELDTFKNNLESKEAEIKKEFNKINKEYSKLDKEIVGLRRDYENIFSNLKKNEEKLSQIKIEGIYSQDLELRVLRDIENTNRILGEIKERLKNLEEQLKLKQKLQEKIETLNKKLRIFEKINRKIGSKNGKKFSKIILKYILDSLLIIANLHLNYLSDERYVLEVVSAGDDFDLKIVDTFFENERRDVKTLSGGEKFLVSLALSFALSDFMKNRVNIESMFLDEGFGTLDREHLNRALEILKKASIGKTIGIISHVESLKEEIEKQITVKKINGGASIIEIKE